FAFRIDDETNRRIAVICQDITEQKLTEQLFHDHTWNLSVNEERQRLARELHDSISQALFSATMIAEGLPRLWQKEPENAAAEFEMLRQTIRGVSAEMRSLLHELRPESIMQTTLPKLLMQLTHAAQAQSTIAASMRSDTDALTLPPEVHLA